MSQLPSTVSDSKASGSAKPVVLPPEPKFWKRYSPHHEFPLSSVTSVCLYALGALLVWAVITLAIKDDRKQGALPVENVLPQSGGGSPEGVGPVNLGELAPVPKKEVVEAAKAPEAPSVPPSRPPDLKDVAPDPLELPEIKNLDPSHFTVEARANLNKLKDISGEFRKNMIAGLGPAKGQGGSGEGGGEGSGVGKGKGPGTTDGKGQINQRVKRAIRWVLLFNTTDGQDYLRQLRGLGAFLAIPDPRGGYLLIRDLNHLPARGEKEDPAALKRIFWIDDKPESVRSLAAALRLPFAPPNIIAFFPEKLENDLLEKELKYRGRQEEEIQETRFRVERAPGGKYVARVESQR